MTMTYGQWVRMCVGAALFVSCVSLSAMFTPYPWLGAVIYGGGLMAFLPISSAIKIERATTISKGE